MYADPQSLTINAVATSFARIGSQNPGTNGVFRTPAGDFSFEVRQLSTKDRFRREVRLTQKKTAADPISALTKEVSATAVITVDEPKWGFSDVELAYLTSAMTAWFTAGNRDKLLGGEL